VFWSSRASGWPRRLLIVAAAALIPAVAGCEAGDNAPTLDWHQPTVGAGTAFHGISIRNVFALGAPLSGTLAAGQSAGLFLALVNTGNPDRLLSIQAPGTATSVTLPGGSIRLGTSGVALLTGPQPKVILTGLTRTLASGTVITVVLNFQKAGSITMRVPVVAQAQSYSTFSPAPSPSPTTTKRKHHPSGSASPSASGSASATPTTTASASASSTP
jgi:copper(I)-binding protein